MKLYGKAALKDKASDSDSFESEDLNSDISDEVLSESELQQIVQFKTEKRLGHKVQTIKFSTGIKIVASVIAIILFPLHLFLRN